MKGFVFVMDGAAGMLNAMRRHSCGNKKFHLQEDVADSGICVLGYECQCGFIVQLPTVNIKIERGKLTKFWEHMETKEGQRRIAEWVNSGMED